MLAIDEVLSCREILSGCVLACANLHVLYVGMLFISAVYEGRPQEDVGKRYESGELYSLPGERPIVG